MIARLSLKQARIGKGCHVAYPQVQRDDDHDKVVYEMEFIENSIKYEIDVAPDGTLLRRHCD